MQQRSSAWQAVALAITTALAALLLGSPPLAAQDADPVGLVQAVSGTVTVISQRLGEQAATPGMSVFAADEVLTGPDSSVQIAFIDQTLVALSQESRVRLGEVMHDPGNAADSVFRMEIIQGAAGLASGEVARHNPDGFQVSTPLSIIGIRGTEFVSLVTPDREVHGLFQGGPVAVTSQGAETSNSDNAELCMALATALGHYERSAQLFRFNGNFAGRRGVLPKIENVEQLMIDNGCTQ